MNHEEFKQRMIDSGQTTSEMLAYISFINNVQFLKEDNGFSQSDFAELLGIDVDQLESIETVQHIPDTLLLFKMLNILNAKAEVVEKKVNSANNFI